MKLNAEQLALISTALDRAWRVTTQPEWTDTERQALLGLAIEAKIALRMIGTELKVEA